MKVYILIGIIAMVCVMIFSNSIGTIHDTIYDPKMDIWEKISGVLMLTFGMSAILWLWPFWLLWIIKNVITNS